MIEIFSVIKLLRNKVVNCREFIRKLLNNKEYYKVYYVLYHKNELELN